MILCMDVTAWMASDVRSRSLVAWVIPRARSTSALVPYRDVLVAWVDPVLPNTIGRRLTVWPLSVATV